MRYRFDPPYPSSREARSDADPRMRASDEERNEVSERLSRHFTDGRLGPDGVPASDSAGRWAPPPAGISPGSSTTFRG